MGVYLAPFDIKISDFRIPEQIVKYRATNWYKTG